ncbi:hypothetical protein B9Z55_023276 [Caenorhabditis nigoni]|uniref:Uncharacterized protein n=1 Tax=Caenorhabditis nigoni TaxID=1611254 RepID=A0A2G5SP61_9PELO|nr:hypothetical protein B9Z55_023276 [Caenorhabditis nigoni]
MNVLQKFIDETFDMMTGLGEMKVAEAIFMDAVHFASLEISTSDSKTDGLLIRKVLSLAYKGRNIMKMCVHLPQNSNAEVGRHGIVKIVSMFYVFILQKYASALNQVSHEIDSLLCSTGSDASD